MLALVVLAGLAAARFLTFRDMTGDANLMRDLEMQVRSEYMPGEVEKLRTAVDSGDSGQISSVAGSVTGTRHKIESVRASAPLLEFSTHEDVVVQVVYSLSDGSRAGERKTLYLLYKHGAVGGTWSLQYKATAVSYYFNFK